MKKVPVFILLLLLGCSQISSKQVVVCDEKKIGQSENSGTHAEEPAAEIMPSQKTGDHTLLLYRMLNTI